MDDATDSDGGAGNASAAQGLEMKAPPSASAQSR